MQLASGQYICKRQFKFLCLYIPRCSQLLLFPVSWGDLFSNRCVTTTVWFNFFLFEPGPIWREKKIKIMVKGTKLYRFLCKTDSWTVKNTTQNAPTLTTILRPKSLFYSGEAHTPFPRLTPFGTFGASILAPSTALDLGTCGASSSSQRACAVLNWPLNNSSAIAERPRCRVG